MFGTAKGIENLDRHCRLRDRHGASHVVTVDDLQKRTIVKASLNGLILTGSEVIQSIHRASHLVHVPVTFSWAFSTCTACQLFKRRRMGKPAPLSYF